MNDPWIYTPPPNIQLAPQAALGPRRRSNVRRLRMLGAIDQQPPPPAQFGYGPQIAKFVVAVMGALAAFYHGYRRHHQSMTWGLVWAGAGFWCPVVTIPFAFSQGFGKRA